MKLTKEDILYAAEIAEHYPPGLPVTCWGLDADGKQCRDSSDVAPGKG